ncbi:Calx-beta domain-containing protein [Micromonospora sp. NPDC050397]|uniref:Calx-beta domain-containing protein n=1 Tax=Micromonospora sp. NPDC050397 TaxID=3364279 RepID=UPI00384AE56C
MTRPRWRIGRLAATVVFPTALLGLTPAASHACCDPADDRLLVSVNGTICWEQPPIDGAPATRARDGRAIVTVTLSQPVKEAVTVLFRTADGTAVAPEDYVAIRQQRVTIPAGAKGVEVPVEIRDDGLREPDEWFVVSISDPSTGTIGQGRAEVVIKDGAPPKGPRGQ